MSTSTLCLRLCVAGSLSVCGFLAGDVTGFAAETLTLKFPPKSTWKIQREQEIAQTLTINGQAIPTKSTTFAVIGYSTGDALPDGAIAVVEKYDVLQGEVDIVGTKMPFDSANPDAQVPTGLEPLAAVMRATFRTPVTTVYDAQGAVREVTIPAADAANLDPNFADLFDPAKRKETVQQAVKLLPKRAIDPGTTWTESMAAPLGAGQTLTFQMEFQYVGPVRDGDKTLHHVKLTHKGVQYSMDPNSPSPLKIRQSDLKIEESKGEFFFDNEQGRMIRESSRVVIGGDLTFVAGGQELPGKLSLTMSSTNTLQP